MVGGLDGWWPGWLATWMVLAHWCTMNHTGRTITTGILYKAFLLLILVLISFYRLY